MGVEGVGQPRSTASMRLAGLWLALLSGWLSAAENPPACAPRPLVLVHVMPWFESKAVSGR